MNDETTVLDDEKNKTEHEDESFSWTLMTLIVVMIILFAVCCYVYWQNTQLTTMNEKLNDLNFQVSGEMRTLRDEVGRLVRNINEHIKVDFMGEKMLDPRQRSIHSTLQESLKQKEHHLVDRMPNVDNMIDANLKKRDLETAGMD